MNTKKKKKKIRFHKGDRVRRKLDGKKLTVLQVFIDPTGQYPQDIQVKEKFAVFNAEKTNKTQYRYLKMWHSAAGYEKIEKSD